MKNLSDIRRSLPATSFEISPIASWMTFARIVFFLALSVWLETLTENILLLIPLWIFHGQVLVGLFVLGHDCGHNSFSKNQMINFIMGHLAFSPLGNGLINWTLTHNHHHSHTQLRGQDVDWSKWLMTRDEFRKANWTQNRAAKIGYLLPFGIFFWIWLNAIRRGFNQSSLAVKKSNLIMWSVMIAVYGGLAYVSGPWGMFKYHGIPASIAMFTGYFLLTIQHANEKSKWFSEKSWSPMRGQLESTFDVRFPRILEWLWLDINIHVPHHVAPGMPWYKLREARLAILSEHGEYYQERKFSLRELTWMMKTPHLSHNERDAVYVLD